MRGGDSRSGELFSYIDLETRVRRDHPLRVIREIANAALEALSGDFAALYSRMGRPSIAPERLLRAMLLQAFYSIRSERQLMERLEYDLLFRWFVGLGVDDAVWDHSTFSKNRDRLLEGDIAAKFLSAILAQTKVEAQLADLLVQVGKATRFVCALSVFRRGAARAAGCFGNLRHGYSSFLQYSACLEAAEVRGQEIGRAHV